MCPKAIHRHTRIIFRCNGDIGQEGIEKESEREGEQASESKTSTEAYRLPSENRKLRLIKDEIHASDPHCRKSVETTARGVCGITTASLRGAHTRLAHTGQVQRAIPGSKRGVGR